MAVPFRLSAFFNTGAQDVLGVDLLSALRLPDKSPRGIFRPASRAPFDVAAPLRCWYLPNEILVEKKCLAKADPWDVVDHLHHDRNFINSIDKTSRLRVRGLVARRVMNDLLPQLITLHEAGFSHSNLDAGNVLMSSGAAASARRRRQKCPLISPFRLCRAASLTMRQGTPSASIAFRKAIS
jgi:hypothetical protein